MRYKDFCYCVGNLTEIVLLKGRVLKSQSFATDQPRNEYQDNIITTRAYRKSINTFLDRSGINESGSITDLFVISYYEGINQSYTLEWQDFNYKIAGQKIIEVNGRNMWLELYCIKSGNKEHSINF